MYIYIYIVFCKCARTERDKSTQTLLLLQLWQHVLHAFGMQSKHFQTFEHVAPYPITQATEYIYARKVLPLLISSYIRKFIIIYLVITLSLLLLQNLFANDNDVQAEVKNCSSWKCPAGFMVPSSKLKLPDPDHATCCEKKLCRGFQCDFASNLLN